MNGVHLLASGIVGRIEQCGMLEGNVEGLSQATRHEVAGLKADAERMVELLTTLERGLTA